MIRWTLHDPSGTLADYTFLLNPYQRDDPELDEPVTGLPTTAGGKHPAMPDTPEPGSWSFVGICRTLAEVTTFEQWMAMGGVTEVADHFGDRYLVLIQDLDSVRRPSRWSPEKQEVTVHCVMLGKVT